jgi:hypothetical protein
MGLKCSRQIKRPFCSLPSSLTSSFSIMESFVLRFFRPSMFSELFTFMPTCDSECNLFNSRSLLDFLHLAGSFFIIWRILCIASFGLHRTFSPTLDSQCLWLNQLSLLALMFVATLHRHVVSLFGFHFRYPYPFVSYAIIAFLFSILYS